MFSSYYVYVNGRYFCMYQNLEHLTQFLQNFVKDSQFDEIEVVRHG